MNPIFPDEPAEPIAQVPNNGPGLVLPRAAGSPGTLYHNKAVGTHEAVELIRSKIDALYDDEPNASVEVAEAKSAAVPRSRHQQFMYELSTSGKSLAEIQTAWHGYYQSLNDAEKHEVWQEFYAANNQQSAYTKYVQKQAATHPQTAVAVPTRPSAHSGSAPGPGQHAQPMQGLPQPARPHIISPTTPSLPRPAVPRPRREPQPTHGTVVVAEHFSPEPPEDKRSFATIKRQVAKRAQASYNAQIKARHHLQSLLFGIGLGSLVLLILLFSFFNEVVVTPFIHPNAHAEATPIILSTDGVAPTNKNEVIIPKINVELPIIYGSSTDDTDIENNLEDGVVHYPTTSLPGQGGNAAFFGHSSNNIFNKGQYKFAFVLLHELEPGDIFYLTYNGKVYTYKVYQKKIVEPTDIGVLNPVADKPATATLITCDPPGTSLRRLVVWGEQISPDPSANSTAPVQQAADVLQQLPSNSPSLWHRLTSWLRGNN